jgi:predicted AlkP superfamily pyrophosphatase or phosphodiesterase
MAALSDKRVIFLDDYIDLSKLDVIDWTPVPGFLPSAGSAVDEIYRTLRNAHPALKLYKRDDLPSRFHYRDNPRIPPLVGVVQEGWMLTSHARYANDLKTRTFGGDHGYDPDVLSMHALFVTAGPRIRHRTIRPFRNIHIYDFMCNVLGLQPAKNDGDPKVLAAILEN